MTKARAKGKTKTVGYRDAVAEIETILESIDREEIDIDELSGKVQRAVELIRLCQGKLRATELQVVEVLKGLEEEAAAAEQAPSAPDDEVPEESDETEIGGELPF